MKTVSIIAGCLLSASAFAVNKEDVQIIKVYPTPEKTIFVVAYIELIDSC